jgi:hypothetical protein
MLPIIWVGLGPTQPNEGTTWFRTSWTTVFSLRASMTRSKRFFGFISLNPFGTKHDGLRASQTSPTKFLALDRTNATSRHKP